MCVYGVGLFAVWKCFERVGEIKFVESWSKVEICLDPWIQVTADDRVMVRFVTPSTLLPFKQINQTYLKLRLFKFQEWQLTGRWYAHNSCASLQTRFIARVKSGDVSCWHSEWLDCIRVRQDVIKLSSLQCWHYWVITTVYTVWTNMDFHRTGIHVQYRYNEDMRLFLVYLCTA